LRRLRLTDTAVLILLAWAGLAYLNHVVGRGVHDVVEIFPLSQFAGPRIVWQGLPYAAGFLFVLLIALRLRPTPARVVILGAALIVFGNLAQGGVGLGFLAPLRFRGGSRYLQAAGMVDGWAAWLRSFTTIQRTLYRQPQTHPPFAVLLHYALRTPALISTVFTAVTSVSIALVWKTLRAAGAGAGESLWLALLFAVIPAVNIYGGVSLDGVVLTASTLFLFGLVRLERGGLWSWPAFVAVAVGLLATNALTFGGVLLVAVGLLRSAASRDVRKAMALSLALAAALYVALKLGFGYDHVRAFVTASKSENPNGFQAIAVPIHYWLTRQENIWNIAVFASVPVLAVLVRKRADGIAAAAVLVLLLMFATGAYRTGETARACLFIYPFLLLTLKDLPTSLIRPLVAAAGVQTVLMQTLGSYGF
jgi:hypothetical protein